MGLLLINTLIYCILNKRNEMSTIRINKLEDLTGNNGILVSDINKATQSALRVLKPALTFPTVRDNGSPLQVGDIITNLADGFEYKYTGTGWLSTDIATLALPDGVGGIGWERQARSPLHTGLKGFVNSSRINLWEKKFVDMAIKPSATVNDPTTWDWAPAIQGAINYIIDIARVQNSTYGIPTLIVPAFFYNLSSGIKTTPWVKIVFEGSSVWDFAKAPNGTNYVTIGSTDLVVSAAIFSPIGACLDGVGGGLLIQGKGPMDQNTSSGLYIGNPSSGMSVVRDVQLKNISVRNCNKAIEFGKYGTYLFSCSGGRLENNFYGIVTPEGVVSNSGERMVFDKCIIGGSGLGGAAILQRCDTFDLFFTNCSFDFNHDVVRLDTGASYASMTFDTCHFEGWDGFLINWNAVGGANFYITINSSTILPTTYRLANPTIINSPSRPLIMFGGSGFGRVDVRINNPIIRHTYNPWTEDPFIAKYSNLTSDPAVRKSVRVTGYDPYSYSAFGTQLSVSNTDYDFQLDAVGTLGTALKCWERAVTPSNVIDDKLVDDGTGKKVLQLTGNNISNYYFIRSKQYYPVKPGSTVYTWSAASLKGLSMPSEASTSLPNVQLGVELQYADGRIVRAPSTTFNLGKSFIDPLMPNFSEGNSRYISTGSFGYLIPEGVIAIRPYIGYTNFVGNLLISRVGMWIQ